jgi:putative PIN family toxin of toxin-antitoxin system
VRLVLDTNVLVSAFITRGAVGEWITEWQGDHQFITSRQILDELSEKLLHKFHLSRQVADGFVSLSEGRMQLVDPVPLSVPVCRDPDDDWVLATAMSGKCDMIVTGDQDLLALGEYSGIPIVSPRSFQDSFASGS